MSWFPASVGSYLPVGFVDPQELHHGIMQLQLVLCLIYEQVDLLAPSQPAQSVLKGAADEGFSALMDVQRRPALFRGSLSFLHVKQQFLEVTFP